MNNYNKAFTEVYEILIRLNKEDYEKIPKEVIEAIKDSRDPDYVFRFEEGVDIENQNYMVETRALLFNIFKDYLANSKQKPILMAMFNKMVAESEEEKKILYDTDVFKTKRKNSSEQS